MADVNSIKAEFTQKAGPLPVYAWVLLIGVVGYIYAKKRSATAATTQTTNGTSATTGASSSDQIDNGQAAQAGLLQADYSLMNQEGSLTGQVANLATNVGANTTAVQGNTTTTGSNTTAIQSNTQAVSATHAKTFVVPGKLNQVVSLRAIAQSLTADPTNANAVQATLVNLVKYNPALKGKTTFLGGHVLNYPAG